MLVHNWFYVLPFTCQFFFMMRVSEDPAVCKYNILSNLRYLSVYFDFLLQLYNIQKLCRQRYWNSSMLSHSQHTNCRDYINHCSQCSSMHSVLYVLLMIQKFITKRWKFGLVLMSIKRYKSSPKILTKASDEMRICVVGLQNLSDC